MSTNFNLEITNFYHDIDALQLKIDDKIFQFLTKASQLVDASEDLYQIEKSITLNKISIKAFILDSPCCKALKDNNISNYSINELKSYFQKYELNQKENCEIYTLALSAYEILEEIETLVDKKCALELTKISILNPKINNIKDVSKKEYEKLYWEIKNDLKKYLTKNLIDNEGFNKCILIINDIFNYYISGYPGLVDDES